jgi:hypothetical protein
MSDLNLKLIQFSNKDVSAQDIDVPKLNSYITTYINSFSAASSPHTTDSTVYLDSTNDTTVAVATFSVRDDEYLSKYKFFLGNDVSLDSTLFISKNNFLITDIDTLIDKKILESNFYPNRKNKMSIINNLQELDLSFVIDRFDIYNRLDDIHDILKLSYDKFVVDAVVIRTNMTFLSNLKLMSKDIYFDLIFKDNPAYLEYFLNSVILVANDVIYDGTTFDMDNLNLNILNISVVNVKDWYVSYKVYSTISDTEIDFIRNNCKLRFEFIDKYNSSIKQYVYKPILIGK